MEKLLEYLQEDLVKARVRLNAFVVEDNTQGIAFNEGVVQTLSTTIFDIVSLQKTEALNNPKA